MSEIQQGAIKLNIEKKFRKRGQSFEVWSRLKKQKVAMFSLAGIILLVVIAIFADRS